METKAKRETEIIIVGGGLAGLAAAELFTQKGIPFLLVEGSDRMGGRINTVHHKGCTLEFGAQWVTGCSPKNPIYQLTVENLKLEGTIDE